MEVVDDYPSSVLAHARRQHRWVRGDWQILLWLFPWVPTRGGRLERNRLPLISRWKIFDNLRRSLLPPATVALLLAAWTVLPGSAGRLDGGRRAGPRLPGVSAAAARCSRGRGRSSRGACSCARNGTRSRRRSCAPDLQLTFMAYHAVEMLHAIGLTLVRLAVTQRRLLEWETAAAAAARAAGLAARNGARVFLAEMAASPILALARRACCVLLAASRRPARRRAACWSLWLAAPARRHAG